VAVVANQLVVNGTLDMSFTSSQAGAFPLAIGLLGLARLDVPLGVLGMPGCVLRQIDLFTFTSAEGGASYPHVTIPLPNDPLLEALPLHVQAIGWAQPPATFVGSVISNALGLRIGNAGFTPVSAQSIFTNNLTTWFSSGAGIFVPILELDGVFP
jgi:hypothetical protein